MKKRTKNPIMLTFDSSKWDIKTSHEGKRSLKWSVQVCIHYTVCTLWYKFTNKTSLHKEANSRASASSAVPVETVISLAQPAFTYYTLGALSEHVVNILMVYNDCVFTVLVQANQPRDIIL